jgi:hypothetical protein
VNSRLLFSKALGDYKNNPKFIIPYLIESIFYLVIWTSVLILIAVIIDTFRRNFSYWNLVNYGPNIPLSSIFLVLMIVIIGVLLTVVVKASAIAAIISMARDTYQDGGTTLHQGWLGTKKYLQGIFLVKIIISSSVLIMIILFSIYSINSGFKGQFSIYLAVLFLILVIIMLSISFFTMFVSQMIVLKNPGVLNSLKSSILFVVTNFRGVIAYGGLVILINLAVFIPLTFIYFLIMYITRYNPFLNLVTEIFYTILVVMVPIIISPYYEIVKTYMVMETVKQEEING